METTHRYFREQGFIELMPVILSTTTDPLGPDPNSSIIATPHIEYMGQNLVLTQSMVLHKQILISFRDDRSVSRRQVSSHTLEQKEEESKEKRDQSRVREAIDQLWSEAQQGENQNLIPADKDSS